MPDSLRGVWKGELSRTLGEVPVELRFLPEWRGARAKSAIN